MLIGLIKWFDKEKGFGVIGTPEEEEYFFHISSFLKKPENLGKGTAIIFSRMSDKKKDRNTAENSRLVGEIEDWKSIFYYLGKLDRVKIEVEIRGRGIRGIPFHRKEIHSFSLVSLSTKQFLKDKSDTEIIKIATDYFDNELDDQNFISYCEQIEYAIKNQFPSEISTYILNEIFAHFGNNFNEAILFEVWKKEKFKFISYTDKDDYEIPESVLLSKIRKIGAPELKRILSYSFGTNFCSHFIYEKFKNIEYNTASEIEDLYQLLEFENESERGNRKYQLDSLYVQKITTELSEQATELGIINNYDDFNNYNRLLQRIPSQFDDEHTNKIRNAIFKIIVQKCSDEFKLELWIKGIIEEAPFELIAKNFLDKDTPSENRLLILSKCLLDRQFELLKLFSIAHDYEKAFTLAEGLVKKENSLGNNFNLSEVLYNSEFWNNKKCSDLISLFIGYVNNESSEEQKYELFFKGYLKDVPHKSVYQNIHNLKESDFRKIIQSQTENKAFINEILFRKVTTDNTNSFEWLYDLANEFLDKKKFNAFDKKVFEKIEQSQYFKLWEKGKAKIFPKHHIEEILDDKFENYSQITIWIENNVTTAEKIKVFLFSKLSNQVTITDRKIFYKQLNYIKYLLQLNELNIEGIKQFQNEIYDTILWFLDKEEVLDFEQLKQKFIYFAPNEQVRIIRKLFFLKANGTFDLTVEKLNELTRIDLDLYRINLNFNPEIPIDISTDVVIKTLLTYKNHERFFVENELLTVILEDIKHDKLRRFRLTNYFENCLGRQIAEYNWSINGKVSKVKYDDNKFYFAITFDYDHDLEIARKSIPEIKCDNKTKVWRVPSQYENEVLEFAKEHRFSLGFEGSNYANNVHLAEFKREESPIGISFCEGRLSNRSHEIFKKEFWWCAGQPCFSKCETIHSKEEWEKFTLLDFCEILGFNTDEINRMGDHIPKGHYYQFIALINRFNRLLDKLYCSDCNHILYPSDFGTSHFAAHTVVRFQCRNETCSNNDVIYLNHCLNGQCSCIIDSRISKKCNNGLYICDNCGSCCSHKMFERRLANLKLTGGYIHDNLRKCVNEKLGHLERAEYFCYKCKSEMTEVRKDVFECPDCNVKYNTTKYGFKRPNIHLRITRATTGNGGSNNKNNDDDFYLPE